jgi:hypothetical protein
MAEVARRSKVPVCADESARSARQPQDVDSKPQQGSTFTVHLPRIPPLELGLSPESLRG